MRMKVTAPVKSFEIKKKSPGWHPSKVLSSVLVPASRDVTAGVRVKGKVAVQSQRVVANSCFPSKILR